MNIKTFNKTSIDFTETLKTYILQFKAKHMDSIEYPTRFQDIEIFQDDMRDKICTEILKPLKCDTSKPNFYTIFLLLLIGDNLKRLESYDEVNEIFIDLCDNFEKYKEITNRFKTDKLQLEHKRVLKDESGSDDFDFTFTCCCGKNGCSTGKLGIISNNMNQKFLFGSSCITKMGIEYTKYCNKKNKEIEDITKLINTPLKNSKKYENVPLGYIIKNDMNYLNFMVKKKRITDINIIKLIDRKNQEIYANATHLSI